MDRHPVVESHIVSLPPIQISFHPEEREYQKRRQKHNWVQPALAALTGVAVILSAYAARETARQASAAEEANRPWLQIESISFEALTLRDDLVNGRARLNYRNIGNEPAQKISLKIHEPIAVMQRYDIANYFNKCQDDILAFTVSPEITFPSNGIVKTIAGGVYKPYPKSDDGELVGCLFYDDSRLVSHVTIFDCPIDFDRKNVHDCVLNAAAN